MNNFIFSGNEVYIPPSGPEVDFLFTQGSQVYDETGASLAINSIVGTSETVAGSIIATSTLTGYDGLVFPETDAAVSLTTGITNYELLTLGEAGHSLTLISGVTGEEDLRLIGGLILISEISASEGLIIDEESHGLLIQVRIKGFDYIRRKRMAKPVLPDVYINIQDGGLGLAGESAAGLHAKVGACSAGAVDTVIALSDADQIAEALGVGPLADACLDSFNAGSRIIYAVPCAKNAGEVGAITEGAGNTGTGTFNATGSPLNAYDVRVEILTSGAIGTATFKYSLDGGQTWSKAITTAATYAVPGTGITLAFTNAGENPEESFIDGDTFTFATTAPAATSAGVLTAVDVLLDSGYSYEFIHVVGAFDSSVWAALDSKAGEAATKYRYIHFLAEAAGPGDEDTVDEWVADLVADTEDFASTRVSVCAGRLAITNTITGVVTARNGAGIYAGHLCSLPKVNISPGRVIDGSLPSVNALAPTGITDMHITTLDQARFVTFRKFVGLNGFYITNGRIMSEEISDFRFAETRRVMDKACSECRLAALRFEHTEANEAGISALKAFTEVPLNRMIGNQEITSAEVVIPPGQDIIGTSEIRVKIRIVPIGVMRWIELDMGLTNPFVSA